MRTDEVRRVATVLGCPVAGEQVLAGGFSHETCLLTLADGERVVVRFGGQDPAVEAGTMAIASRYVPVPQVLRVLPAAPDDKCPRPAMILAYVTGTPLSTVLAVGNWGRTEPRELGSAVGQVSATISSVSFDRPGFFADAQLTVTSESPWSRQLAQFAEQCMAEVPGSRLDSVARRSWARLCAAHAPALADIDDHARLVHADLNPKNILVTKESDGWRVAAILDWEFSYSGCPYADAANMARFGADYPDGFLDGFHAAFAAHLPTDLPPAKDRAYLGRLLDMFALSELVTRPIGHPIADRAAQQIQRWLANGIPGSPATDH